MEGTTLRELRKAKGWTQARLAQEAGINSRNVQDYEVSRKKIPRATVRLFTLLLTVDAQAPTPPSAGSG